MLLFIGISSFTFGQSNTASRAPFILELPGVSQDRFNLPIVKIGAIDLPKLKIRVVEPFAANIDYGKVIVTLNGDGLNRGCSKFSDSEGKVIECGKREDRLGGYVLAQNKNVLEMSAVDRKGQEYYASFVIILGDRSAGNERSSLTNVPVEKFVGRKFAVIVGVSEYRHNDAGLSNLDYADDDARAIADFLKTPGGGGFLPADTKLLIDRDASITALRSALNETAKKAGRNDLVFIFLAGHGAPDPLSAQNLYFLFYDTKVVDMERTAFPMAELKRYLDTQILADRVFVVIDTCHSAGVNQNTKSLVTGRQLTQPGDENNLSNFALSNQLFKERGRAVITSSDVNEVSRESSKWGNHGVFTWALLQGLNGAADLNDDHLVTAGELFQYTRSTVQNATNAQQNPIALPGSNANLALAIVKKKSS